MFRKIFVCALMLTVMFCLTGCGGDKSSSNPGATADKAVLACAELATHGKSENATAAGFTDTQRAEFVTAIVGSFIANIADVAPLNEQSAQIVAAAFYEKFSKDMHFTATLKKDDATSPVVELKTTPMDSEAAIQAAGTDDEWIALVGIVGQLKSDGVTDDQLKSNKDVQTAAVNALTKYIKSIPMQSEQTFDVTCAQVKGSDGKTHWAPADLKAFTNFLTGQK